MKYTLIFVAFLILLFFSVTNYPQDQVDYLKEETVVRLFWHDDILAHRDTMVLAVSIKKTADDNFVVLPKNGNRIICDAWKPEIAMEDTCK